MISHHYLHTFCIIIVLSTISAASQGKVAVFLDISNNTDIKLVREVFPLLTERGETYEVLVIVSPKNATTARNDLLRHLNTPKFSSFFPNQKFEWLVNQQEVLEWLSMNAPETVLCFSQDIWLPFAVVDARRKGIIPINSSIISIMEDRRDSTHIDTLDEVLHEKMASTVEYSDHVLFANVRAKNFLRNIFLGSKHGTANKHLLEKVNSALILGTSSWSKQILLLIPSKHISGVKRESRRYKRNVAPLNVASSSLITSSSSSVAVMSMSSSQYNEDLSSTTYSLMSSSPQPSASPSVGVSPSVSSSPRPSSSPSVAVSPSMSSSTRASSSPSVGVSPSMSSSPRTSSSPSVGVSPSMSTSPRPSISPSVGVSPSMSSSPRPSMSPSVGVSPSMSSSPRPSSSPSVAVSPSMSSLPRPSSSPSVGVSPSMSSSTRPSSSPSVVVSPSMSTSPRPSISPSIVVSPSMSSSPRPSISPSVGVSPSMSSSPRSSSSPSVAHSLSMSSSPRPSSSPSVAVSPSMSSSPRPSSSPSVVVSPSMSSSTRPSISPSVAVSPSMYSSPRPSSSPSVGVSPSMSSSTRPSISPSVGVSPSMSSSPRPSSSSSVGVSPSMSSSPRPSSSSSVGVSPSMSSSPGTSASTSVAVSPPSMSVSPRPSTSSSVAVSPSISSSPQLQSSSSYFATPSISAKLSTSSVNSWALSTLVTKHSVTSSSTYFYPDTTPSTTQKPTTAPRQEKKRYLITFKGDCEKIVSNPVQKEEFMKQFKETIATIISISVEDIHVDNIRCGSILVTFTVAHASSRTIEELEKALNDKRLKVQLKETTYVASKVEVVKPSPTSGSSSSSDKKLAFWLYVSFGAAMGLIFLIGLIVLLVRCRRDRLSKTFVLSGDADMELKRYRGMPRSSYYRVEMYGDPMEADAVRSGIDEEYDGEALTYRQSNISLSSSKQESRHPTNNVSSQDEFYMGNLPEWKVPKLKTSEVVVNDSNEDRKSDDDGDDVLHAYDNPVMTFGGSSSDASVEK